MKWLASMPPVTYNYAHHRVSVLPVVEDIPQIDQDRYPDRNDGQNAVDLRAPHAGHEDAREGKPCPPFSGELPVTQLLEANV